MPSTLELSRYHEPGCFARRDPGHLALSWGASLLCALTTSFFITSLPLASALCVAGAGISCLALAVMPCSRRHWYESVLEQLAPSELHDTYGAILVAHDELLTAIAEAPGIVGPASTIRERCDASVRTCGRVALVANRSRAYLAAHDVSAIDQEAVRLRNRSAAARDDVTARDFGRAAAAREQQLATCAQLAETCERVQAGLERVLASFAAFTAAVVRSRTLEAEQLALAGESLAAHADELLEDLETVESAALDLAA